LSLLKEYKVSKIFFYKVKSKLKTQVNSEFFSVASINSRSDFSSFDNKKIYCFDINSYVYS